MSKRKANRNKVVRVLLLGPRRVLEGRRAHYRAFLIYRNGRRKEVFNYLKLPA